MIIDFGLYSIDLTPIGVYFSTSSPMSLFLDIFFIAGWVGIAYILIEWGLQLLVDELKEKQATKDWKWVTLAIDVPAFNLETPKSVEQMFSHLAGALDTPDIAAKFRKGHKQRWFSFEIISIEGYIQFLIHTEEKLRDLVEAALYAQYPDAEMVEVLDYTIGIPDTFPDEKYDMWATDFGLTEDQSIPIRSYVDFEHSISKDTVLKDPMGTFLESFSRIGPGEQMWFQIIVQPISNSWKKSGIDKIDDMLGKKTKTRGNAAVDVAAQAPINMVGFMNEQIFGKSESDLKNGGVKEESSEKKISDLTPGQRKIVEAIEEKIMKTGFKAKLRGIYLGEKDVFRPEKGVQALIGAVNQYNIPSHNSLVPEYGVSASYVGAKKKILKRKAELMKAYKKRKISTGAKPYVLNIEELATIWHFPMSYVKTPLLQKAYDKKAEAPAGLPMEILDGMTPPGLMGDSAPTALPVADPGYDLDTGSGYDEGQQFG